jgi:hypothetical protein
MACKARQGNEPLADGTGYLLCLLPLPGGNLPRHQGQRAMLQAAFPILQTQLQFQRQGGGLFSQGRAAFERR